jgi:endonuclease/exonuclease/phosphatase family metal-dependent hydrolase
MTHSILILLLVHLLPLLLLVNPTDSASQKKEAHSNESLFEVGQAETLRTPLTDLAAEKVISFNIRFRSGDDLKELVRIFREDKELGNATIIGLQEVDRNKKRSGNANTAKFLADQLGLYYAWAAPPTAKPNQEEETGVAILSVYPLSNVRRIVLPHEGPDNRRRAAIGATVKIRDSYLRIYSAHAETRISMDKKKGQLKSLLEDLAQEPEGTPAIIMGDLNTWQPNAGSETKKLFTKAGLTTPFDDQTTFSQKILFVPLKMRLDWMWMRGLEVLNHGIDKKVTLSDHWPLWVDVKFASKTTEQQKR